MLRGQYSTLFFRTARYSEFRPPIIVTSAPGAEERRELTLPARQNLSITCLGHKPVTWHVRTHAEGHASDTLTTR